MYVKKLIVRVMASVAVLPLVACGHTTGNVCRTLADVVDRDGLSTSELTQWMPHSLPDLAEAIGYDGADGFFVVSQLNNPVESGDLYLLVPSAATDSRPYTIGCLHEVPARLAGFPIPDAGLFFEVVNQTDDMLGWAERFAALYGTNGPEQHVLTAEAPAPLPEEGLRNGFRVESLTAVLPSTEPSDLGTIVTIHALNRTIWTVAGIPDFVRFRAHFENGQLVRLDRIVLAGRWLADYPDADSVTIQ